MQNTTPPRGETPIDLDLDAIGCAMDIYPASHPGWARLIRAIDAEPDAETEIAEWDRENAGERFDGQS